MENKSHALAAGVFVLVAAALLLAFAAWLTTDTSEQRIFEITSREGVTGLQPQAAVRYKGVLVGRVTEIELDPQQAGNVLVRIAVNAEAPVSQSTYATLGFQGLTGLSFIALDDAGEPGKPLVASATQWARIPMRPGMMSRLSEQGNNLLLQLEQASQRVNTLMAPENQKTMMTTIGNLGQAAAGIAQLTQRADRMLDPAASDDAFNLPRTVVQANATLKSMQGAADRADKAADAYRGLAVRLSEPGGTLDKIAQSTESLAATSQSLNSSLMPRLNRTADETSRAARNVGRAVDAVNDNPQSLLLGRGAALPGPGESGFAPPAANR